MKSFPEYDKEEVFDILEIAADGLGFVLGHDDSVDVYTLTSKTVDLEFVFETFNAVAKFVVNNKEVISKLATDATFAKPVVTTSGYIAADVTVDPATATTTDATATTPATTTDATATATTPATTTDATATATTPATTTDATATTTDATATTTDATKSTIASTNTTTTTPIATVVVQATSTNTAQ